VRLSVFLFFFVAAIVPAIPADAAQIIDQPRPPGEIFATPLQVFEVRSGAEQGQLQVRYLRARSGYANGTVFGGDRVAGYHHVPPAGQRETLSLVRYRGTTAIQIIGAAPSGGGWSGLAVAVDATAGATQLQNTVGFRASPTNCLPGPNCVSGGIPNTPQAPMAFNWTDPLAGLPLDANGFRGVLVLRADSARTLPGAFVGFVLGERILGHYGSGAGTLGFLRFDASGAPYQAWLGVLDQNGGSSGSGYPLAPNGGEPFSWSGQIHPQAMVSVRSSTGNSRCLTQGPALSGACLHEWLLLPTVVSANNPTLFRFVNKANGLCLDLAPAGALARESRCSGIAATNTQQFTISNFAAGPNGGLVFSNSVNTLADFFASSNLRLSSAGSCLIVRASDLALVSGGCSDARANWAQVL
jgi:hypothetical protein